MGDLKMCGACHTTDYCAQCHGSGAAGVEGKGYPSLLDNDWLWGGDMEAIHTTITHGIRNTTDPDARYSEMPKFGADGLLEPAQIDAVVEHVLAISGQEHDAAKAAEGATVFAENCAACHGANLQGQPDWKQRLANGRMPAPPHDATGHTWHHSDRDLYNLTKLGVATVMGNGYESDMPAFGGKLSDDDIRAVLAYIRNTWPDRKSVV